MAVVEVAAIDKWIEMVDLARTHPTVGCFKIWSNLPLEVGEGDCTVIYWLHFTV